ncbi:MAG: BON domain-containing protein [Thermoproteota archaeon]|nr:BON domain-containing protein [Thermoproteota archaeon]
MSDKGVDEEEEPRKEQAKDYFAGYYFGKDSYTSSDNLPGRKSDEELEKDVLYRIRNNQSLDAPNVNVRVVDSSVILTGQVRTYAIKEEVGKKAWETKGVSKVLNELEVTNSERAGE